MPGVQKEAYAIERDRERERERKKYGRPNTSVLNKRRSRTRRNCKSGVSKLFKVSVPIKHRNATNEESDRAQKTQSSKDVTFVG